MRELVMFRDVFCKHLPFPWLGRRGLREKSLWGPCSMGKILNLKTRHNGGVFAVWQIKWDSPKHDIALQFEKGGCPGV